MRPSSSIQLSTSTPPNTSAMRHAGMESYRAGAQRPVAASRAALSATTSVSCSRTRTSTIRVPRLVGSNTGKRTWAPTSRPPPTARRIGTTEENTGGWARRKLSSCSLPAERIATWSVVSAPTEPVAWKRPTSLSSEKVKSSMTRAGLSLTRVRATADPVCPSAGSSRSITSSSTKPSGTVSSRDVACPTVRPPS